jgi:hypothetical protein
MSSPRKHPALSDTTNKREGFMVALRAVRGRPLWDVPHCER